MTYRYLLVPSRRHSSRHRAEPERRELPVFSDEGKWCVGTIPSLIMSNSNFFCLMECIRFRFGLVVASTQVHVHVLKGHAATEFVAFVACVLRLLVILRRLLNLSFIYLMLTLREGYTFLRIVILRRLLNISFIKVT